VSTNQIYISPQLEREFKRHEAIILDAGGKTKRAYLRKKEGFIASCAEEQSMSRRRSYRLWMGKCIKKWGLLND
jgi:hypothetical protein